MTAKRLSMRKIKEILRLKYHAQLKHRQIARSLKISPSTVSRVVNSAHDADVTWPTLEHLTEDQLFEKIYGHSVLTLKREYAQPNFQEMHIELKSKGVTKQLLWEEYKMRNKENAYGYTQFCYHYRDWLKSQSLSMRQTHVAGEKMFVDYAGKTIPITNPKTGDIKKAQIFVAVLGASSYTFAEATATQSLPDWVQSHVHAFNYFDGVPEITVPDNLKSGVSKACKYDPDLNPTYHQLSCHYGFAIIPARIYKPKDKSKVELGVQVVTRWILARLRKREFFSLGELNKAIRVLLEELNNRPFKKLPGSRRSTFLQLDKPALKPLPKQRYEFEEILFSRAYKDYHVEADGHYYSVPYQLAQKKIEVRLKSKTLSCFYKGKQIAIHPRSFERGRHTTLFDHMPENHKAYYNWTPDRFLNRASEIGIHATEIIQMVLNKRQHPQVGYRACLGILNLEKEYGVKRLEQACRRAIVINAPYRKNIQLILKNGMDKLEAANQETTTLPLHHENVRGAQYFC